MRQARTSWLLAMLLAVACLALSCNRLADEELQRSVKASVAATRQRGASSLHDFYQARHFAPVWIDRGGLADRGASLLRSICAAGDLGLRPADYDPNRLRDLLREALQEAGSREDRARRLADLELALSQKVVEMVSDARAGRLNLPRLQDNWHYAVGPRAAKAREVLERVADSYDLAAALQDRRTDDETGAMVEALSAYRRIAEAGGWATIPAGPTLRPGSTGARVTALRARLRITNDSRDPGASRRFDAALAEAVRRFQRRHGLEPTGHVDEASRRAMNVTVAERISQLELNLERERWLPDRHGHDYVLVNIPEFMLHAYRSGKGVLDMRVIVGASLNQTPIFADDITYIVFRPYWNVPQSIVIEEILPALEENPDHLMDNGFTVVDSADRVIAAAQVAARRPAAASGPGPLPLGRSEPLRLDEEAIASGKARIRQEPGPTNALGLIKFMFPNQFDIYLHATPANRLFAGQDRALSHGCIRVEDPVRLAEHLLEANGEWTKSRIVGTMQDPDVVNEEVGLKRRIPVYIVYLTAWVDDLGRVQFRDDVYEQDRRLRAAIERSGNRKVDPSACHEIERLLSIAAVQIKEQRIASRSMDDR